VKLLSSWQNYYLPKNKYGWKTITICQFCLLLKIQINIFPSDNHHTSARSRREMRSEPSSRHKTEKICELRGSWFDEFNIFYNFVQNVLENTRQSISKNGFTMNKAVIKFYFLIHIPHFCYETSHFTCQWQPPSLQTLIQYFNYNPSEPRYLSITWYFSSTQLLALKFLAEKKSCLLLYLHPCSKCWR
jgi:hypothetical protein